MGLTTTRSTNRYAGGAIARASLARAAILLTGAIAAVLVLAIVLTVLEANRSNDVVQLVRDAAGTLAGPLDGLFKLDSNKAEKAVNWGLAAVVWLALGRLVARMLVRH
jgi:hypothetical protein